MPRALSMVVALLSVWLAVGCGGSSPNASRGSSQKDVMEDIGQMLKALADEQRKPPTKLAELEAVEPMMPIAASQIRSGEVVYIWGAGYASGSNKVVAHEKKAATDGGWVLLQDGTVKEMTATEFAAAPKAKL